MASKIFAALKRFIILFGFAVGIYLIGYTIIFGLIAMYNYLIEAARIAINFVTNNVIISIIIVSCILLASILSEIVISKKDKNDKDKENKKNTEQK